MPALQVPVVPEWLRGAQELQVPGLMPERLPEPLRVRECQQVLPFLQARVVRSFLQVQVPVVMGPHSRP